MRSRDSASSARQKRRGRVISPSLDTTRAYLEADARAARAGGGHADKARSSSPPTQVIIQVITDVTTQVVFGEDYSLVSTLRGFKREALTVIKNQLPWACRAFFRHTERGERALVLGAAEQAFLKT